MNYNANSASHPSLGRKAKRVYDVNAMGYNPYDNNTTKQQFYSNLPAENTSIPYPNDPQFANASYGMPTQPNMTQPYNPAMPYINNTNNPTDNLGVFKQPIVQDFAIQYGQQIASTGTNMIKKEVNRFIPVTTLKYYFAVNNTYVLKKIMLLFFPFTHSDWTIKYQEDSPIQPRYEINAPDLYIPTMAYITYILIASLLLGTQQRFSPEKISVLASSALAWWVVELVIYNFILYVSSIQTQLKTFDLMAYSGYKFVGTICSLLISLLASKTGYYISLIYSSLALAFFLVRNLKLQVLGESPQAGYYGEVSTGRKRRLHFLLFIALTQPFLSWWLSFDLIGNSVFKIDL